MPNSPQGTRIRLATDADAAALSALGRRTFTDAFGSHNTPENLAAFLDAAYTADVQRRELGAATHTYLVAESGEELVAFALLRTDRQFPMVADPRAVELQRLYVDSAWHGTGLAQQLMAECRRRAQELGAETLVLGVWEHNPRAIKFYTREGFVPVGQQVFTVGDDPQTDIVMMRRLPG